MKYSIACGPRVQKGCRILLLGYKLFKFNSVVLEIISFSYDMPICV